MLIGIIGNGFVGKATKLFCSESIKTIVYDIRPEACEPIGTKLEELEQCDLIFICLPTPMNHNSNCYTNIVLETVQSIKNPYKIIRSTVPIGFSNSLHCYFMPEFLTELNWRDDFMNANYWVFGLKNGDKLDEQNCEFKRRIEYLISTSHLEGSIKSNKIYWLTNSEAECLKLIKNTYLAAKVCLMNEIYDFCQAKSVDYSQIINILKEDPRIGKTHLNVPGYNQKRGFGGTCFPKDTHSLYSQFQESGIKSYIFPHILYRNDVIDRSEREWRNDYWRTTIPTDKAISLVTGGAGFLGSNLCKKLLEMGHIVICLDNLETGQMKNIEELQRNHNFLFKRADIIDKQFFPRIDYIWHLACPASPPKYQKDGYKTLQTCIVGTMNVLELAKTHNCPMLFSSTSEVYGDPKEHPQKETYWGNVNPVGERSCYDEGKRVAETLISEYRKKNHELVSKLKIVRIFNTYGPYMDINDGRVITNYIKCILNNKPITIYGDGSQTRSFCYVDDMIEGFIKMMWSDEIGPVNLGNPYCEFTMVELVDIFNNILDKKLEVIYLTLPNDDPKQRKPCIKLAKSRLNWEPKIELMDGLKKTYDFFNYYSVSLAPKAPSAGIV